MMSNQSILDEVCDYYNKKILAHGAKPAGVDWNGEKGQTLRFTQLLKIIQDNSFFSISDIGCGYGALVDHLRKNFNTFEYFGSDISIEMINAAIAKYGGTKGIHFNHGLMAPKVVDYSIASGIFNVKNTSDDKGWESYILSTIDLLNDSSTKGFSFNCLTKYSDFDKKKNYLYYSDPCWIFDHCKKKYSRNVSLLHDYDLYEFTILVRK